MDDDILEWDLVGKVERRHYHARNPQAHNVASGRQHLRWVGGLQLIGIFRPSLRSKRPQLRGEPGIKNIFVLMDMAAALWANVGVFHQSVFPAAGITIEHRNTMAPPKLTRNTPILQVLQPIKVNLLPACRVELDFTVLHHFGSTFLQSVNRNKPLLRQPRLELGVAAIARHNRMIVIFHMIKKTQSLKFRNDCLTRFVARHAAELAIALNDNSVLIENVDLLKVVALAHGIVVRIMSGSGLHATRAELGVDIVVGKNRNLTAHNRQIDRLANKMLITLVLRAYRNTSIAQHGFGTGGGNNHIFHSVDWLGKRVAQVPQVALFIYVFSLIIGNSSSAGRAPIDDSTTLVNEAIVVPIAEHLANSIGVFG